MKKKNSRRGFTLAEMLIAVLLLGLISAMAAVMCTTILSTTASMQEIAQAEVLGNEILDNLRRELRFGQNIQIVEKDGESVLTYDYDDTNTGYSFGVNDEGMVVLQHQKDGETVSEPLFAGVSYGKNLKIQSLTFTAKGRDAIAVSVSISYGGKALWTGNITIKPLNGTVGTSSESA